MKYVVILGDGMADHPLEQLDGNVINNVTDKRHYENKKNSYFSSKLKCFGFW